MVVFARVHLGMKRREFGRLSPRVFSKMCKAVVARQYRADEMTELMGGQLIAMVANTGFARFKDPRQAEEFMPSCWRAEAAAKRRRPKRLTKKERERQEAAGWARYNASRAAYIENSKKAGQQVVVTAPA